MVRDKIIEKNAIKPGRPRSKKIRKAILTAAYELLETCGFQNVTVDGIAEKAAVSKATIYKWWPNKAAVVLDSFFEASETMLQIPDTGSIEEDLFIQVSSLSAFLSSQEGKAIREFIAEGQFDAGFAAEYRKRYFLPRRAISAKLLERGIERGELKAGLDAEHVTDLIFAPLFYRLLIMGENIDSTYVRTQIGYVMTGLRRKA